MVRFAALVWCIVSLAGAWSRGWSQAPRVWKTDLRIRSFDLMAIGQQSVQITVGIVSDGDDAARATRLEFFLPVSVGLVRAPAGCKASPAAVANLSARVTCELGDIPGRGLREVILLTSAPPAGSMARFAAIVFSDTPDAAPSNNFAERAAP